MIICVDYDGTLCKSDYPHEGSRKLIHRMIGAWIRRRHRKGDIIILNTLREGELLDTALSACEKWGIPIDYANMNEPKSVMEWQLDPRKIACDLNIDDKNIGLLGWILRRIENGNERT